jgi:hypothetical protein
MEFSVTTTPRSWERLFFLSVDLERQANTSADEVFGKDRAYNEFTGEMPAIHEFNAGHEDIKIAPVQGLRFYGGKLPSMWHEQIFVAHLFLHPDYGRPISDVQQLPLGD